MPHSPQDLHKKILGKKGEKLAQKFLKKRGYEIIKTNYTTPFGEADIVAKSGEYVVFVEVKTRTSDKYGTPAEAVNRTKRDRYIKIAKCYWLETGEEPNARFDVVEVWANGEISLIENAF